jgi:formiminotetrahydrofolate cyclodeaminase
VTAARLAGLSVSEFAEAVASADQPVPAGGSVAALTAANAAALLALVCAILGRRQPGTLVGALEDSRRLQRDLLMLVDEDAAAFRAFLDAKRSGVDAAIASARISEAPLQVCRASAEILALSDVVEAHTLGPPLADVRAARYLACAALRAALDIVEENRRLLGDAPAGDDELRRMRQLLPPFER